MPLPFVCDKKGCRIGGSVEKDCTREAYLADKDQHNLERKMVERCRKRERLAGFEKLDNLKWGGR